MKKKILHFTGRIRSWMDESMGTNASHMRSISILVPEEKIDDFDYISNLLLKEISNSPSCEDFKDKIFFIEGEFIFTDLEGELQEQKVIIKDIHKDKNKLTGTVVLNFIYEM